ncbi:pilus assembly protein CpaE [Aquisediminimonas sediminicola]|uniref:pilus assembly protein CpaE n=1 Tax=Alteraquisediminimonas sediminicola TaxID=2676787 RepID=UPI001C8D2285|nr:pilus assembly protein CpaE [Aquisediminimonas sediminicola]
MNAPWNPARGSMHREPFIGFVCDDATAEFVKPVAAEFGWSIEKINKGGLRNAVQTLSVSASPHVLFVDMSESVNPLQDINALAEVCEPGTVVIAAGHVNDVRLYRDLLTSGIQDYLLKPFTPDQLRDAFAHAQMVLAGPRNADGAPARPHSLTAVIGIRGGVGASSVATSLAWSFAEKKQRLTALLDLDLHFGTAALSMDLEPGRGLVDAIENPGRIDGLFLERAMVKASDMLSILSAEASMNRPMLTDGSAFFQLQEEIRAAFECTVVDIPRNILIQHPHLLHVVNAVVVVTELTLAATRDMMRLLGWFKSNAPAVRIIVVANKVPVVGGSEISRKDFESSIEHKIDYVIGFDQKVAVQATKLCRTLADVGKGNRHFNPLGELVEELLALSDGTDDGAGYGAGKSGDGAKSAKAAGGPTLMNKLNELKAMLPSKGKAKVG